MQKIAVFLALLFCGGVGVCGGADLERKWTELLDGREGCFVLYDDASVRYVRFNPEGCRQQFSPCSTFKIANAVSFLETGVAAGPEFRLRWDGVKRGYAAWDCDQTLRSAFQNSAVWYFQELTRRVGPVREAEFVRKFRYGNVDTSGGATNFWLESSLKISAEEQLEFLRRLWKGELPVSRDAQRLTREMMEVSRRGGHVLYGKTGTGGDRADGVARLGWFVGCVVRGENRVFFAARITGERDAGGRQAREISEAILKELGFWPKE